MSVFRKQVLRVGTYQSPEGTVDVTPERLQHWSSAFRRVQANGYQVPIHWNHARLDDTDNLAPIRMSAKPKADRTVGHLHDFQVSPAGDSATLVLEVKTPSAKESVESNSTFVSPVLWDEWVDGHGHKHQDVIGSVDLVDYPVDHSQGPFEPVTTMSAKAKIIRLSLTPEEPMADEYNENDDIQTLDAMPEPDMVPETNSVLSSVLSNLSMMDLVLPPDTDTGNFLERLNVALMTAAAHQDEEPVNPNDVTPEPPEAVMPAIATMSARVRQLEDQILQGEKQAVKNRLEALLKSGRCTPAEHREKSAALNIQRMSLTKEGKANTGKLGDWIESREAIPEGACWDPAHKIKRMSNAKAEPAKSEWTPNKEPVDIDELKRQKDQMLRR